jgi:hypothetical protein
MSCKNRKYRYTVEYIGEQNLNTLPTVLNSLTEKGSRVVQVLIEKNIPAYNDKWFYVILEEEV